MKTAWSVSVLIWCVLMWGCEGDNLSAPTAGLEPISVIVQERTAMSSESIPAVRISGGVYSINFQVTTKAACATLVGASYRVEARHVDIVTHVGGNPTANCAAIPTSTVADYHAEVRGLEPGAYSVSVFEARGGDEPRFIGSGKGTSFATGN
jgi:hypothetical protein